MQNGHLWLHEEIPHLDCPQSRVLDHIDLNGLAGAISIARRHESDLTAERPQIQRMILLTRVQHRAVLYLTTLSEI